MMNLKHGGLAATAISLLCLSSACAGSVANEPPAAPPRPAAVTPAQPQDHHANDADDSDSDDDLDPAPSMNAARAPVVLPRG